MKLRIKGNSLRLRLTQGELTRLAQDGVVAEQVPFAAGASLHYRVVRDNVETEISAAYKDNRIEIRVPEQALQEWSSTALVTLSREQPAGADTLRIVLEKDFACLSPREGEDESDHFPHPASGTGKSC